MTLSLHFTTSHVSLAFGACDENIRIGPLSIYLGLSMQGVTWRDRFDFICEKDDARPLVSRLFGTWKDSEEERGGFFLGRRWNLLTGSQVLGRA